MSQFLVHFRKQQLLRYQAETHSSSVTSTSADHYDQTLEKTPDNIIAPKSSTVPKKRQRKSKKTKKQTNNSLVDSKSEPIELNTIRTNQNTVRLDITPESDDNEPPDIMAIFCGRVSYELLHFQDPFCQEEEQPSPKKPQILNIILEKIRRKAQSKTEPISSSKTKRAQGMNAKSLKPKRQLDISKEDEIDEEMPTSSKRQNNKSKRRHTKRQKIIRPVEVEDTTSFVPQESNELSQPTNKPLEEIGVTNNRAANKPDVHPYASPDHEDQLVIGPNGTLMSKAAWSEIDWTHTAQTITCVLSSVFDCQTLESYDFSDDPQNPDKKTFAQDKLADVIHIITSRVDILANELRMIITKRCYKCYRSYKKGRRHRCAKVGKENS